MLPILRADTRFREVSACAQETLAAASPGLAPFLDRKEHAMTKFAAVALIAYAASLTPAVAGGEGCNHAKQASMSCAEGTAWDAKARACVKLQS